MEVIQGGGQSTQWLDHVRREALNWALNTCNNFNASVQKAGKKIPQNTPQNRGQIMEIMVDAFIGSCVSMGVAYCGDTLVFEEAMVDLLRHKFKEIRKAKIMGKMNQPEKLPIQPEEPA